MKLINQDTKDTLTFRPVGQTRAKSQLRLDIESLEPGQMALFKNGGEDYKSIEQLRNVTYALRAKAPARLFEVRELASRDGAVVTRTV